MIPSRGGASEPSDMRLPGRAGGAVVVRRTLVSTICRIADPTQVSRQRQLRDASTVMRFQPAHQSVINRRHDDRASCPVRQSLEPMLERKPRIHLPATWNGRHESGQNLTLVPSGYGWRPTHSRPLALPAGAALHAPTEPFAAAPPTRRTRVDSRPRHPQACRGAVLARAWARCRQAH